MEGIWTIGGVKYDFDLAANLEAFETAANQIELNKALVDLGIENVKVENMPAYDAKKDAFLEKLAKDEEELTVEAIQAWVDKVNADAIGAEEETAIVKAVVDAKKAGNQIAFAQAIQNDAFTRVNAEWITDYDEKIVISGEGAISEESTIEDIQGLINSVNNGKVNAKAEKTKDNVDRAELLEAKALIEEYATPTEKGEQQSTTKTALKAIDTQLAVVDVREASTPTRLKNALIALDEFLAKDAKIMVKTDAYKGYIDDYAKAYLTEIANFETGEKGSKTKTGVLNAADVRTAINSVNAEKDKAAEGLKIDFTFKQSSTNGVGYTKFSEKIDDKGVFKITGDFLALEEFEEDGTTPPSTQKWIGIGIVFGNGENNGFENNKVKMTINGEVREEKLGYFQDKVFGEKNELYKYIAAKAGGAEYKFEFEVYGTGGDADTVIKKDGFTVKFVDELSQDGVVVLVNEAETAADVSSALVKLGGLKGENQANPDFLNVPSADRLFVAKKVLEARNEIEAGKDGKGAKQFWSYNNGNANNNSLLAALDEAISVRNAALDGEKGVNKLHADSPISDVIVALKAVDPEGFAEMSIAEQSDIAEAFFAGLEFVEIETEGEPTTKLKTPFRTLAAVKEAAGL